MICSIQWWQSCGAMNECNRDIRRRSALGLWCNWHFQPQSFVVLCILLRWQVLLLMWWSWIEGAKTIPVCQGLQSRQLHLCRKWIKNHKGTFGNSKDCNKVVTILATNDLPNVSLIFISRDCPNPWEYGVFLCQTTGEGSQCKEAGIEKTNHSLQATSAIARFAAGVPEKVIKEVTGHKPSKALEIYERPTVHQKQALSNVLNGSCRGDFGAEVTKMQGGEKELLKTSTTRQNGGTPFMGSLFQGLNNCTVNITP